MHSKSTMKCTVSIRDIAHMLLTGNNTYAQITHFFNPWEFMSVRSGHLVFRVVFCGVMFLHFAVLRRWLCRAYNLTK